MRLERTQDAALIRDIVTHPAIWPHVSEDGTDKELWGPIIADSVYQLAIIDDDGIGGVFILVPQSSVCWEVHTCILPSHRGEKAREATKLCAEWMFSNTECLHIITKVPAYNKPAYRLARDTGLIDIGVIKSAWVSHGEIQDLYLLGVAKWPSQDQ